MVNPAAAVRLGKAPWRSLIGCDRWPRCGRHQPVNWFPMPARISHAIYLLEVPVSTAALFIQTVG